MLFLNKSVKIFYNDQKKLGLFMQTIILFVLCLILTSHAACDSQKTIAIVTYKVYGAKPWDPDSIHSGVTGSEEAVIYVSQKLATLGYQVTVLGNPPEDSPHSAKDANPRFVDDGFDDGTHYDIAISWRMPDKALLLKQRATKVYLWPHDTYHWPLTEEQISGFDDVLWLSNWQREQWMSINPGFATFTQIIGNGINPEQFSEVTQRKNPYSCIYSSNYARGLEILLDIWLGVKQEFPQATLDIYYGWQHWGLLSPEKEAKMRAQIATLRAFGVHDHGLVSHQKLNDAYAQASLWTYPCIGLEVFCITAIRAQVAGCVPVIIDGHGLIETVRHGYRCTKPDEYLATLLHAMREIRMVTVDERQKIGNFVREEYTWGLVAEKWKRLFESGVTTYSSLQQTHMEQR